MSLSRSESLRHLGEVPATTGIDVPEIVLLQEDHVILRKMRFRYRGRGQTVQGDNPKALVAELRRFLAAHREVLHGTH